MHVCSRALLCTCCTDDTVGGRQLVHRERESAGRTGKSLSAPQDARHVVCARGRLAGRPFRG